MQVRAYSASIPRPFLDQIVFHSFGNSANVPHQSGPGQNLQRVVNRVPFPPEESGPRRVRIVVTVVLPRCLYHQKVSYGWVENTKSTYLASEPPRLLGFGFDSEPLTLSASTNCRNSKG